MSSEDLLKLLEAHGRQFLRSFDIPKFYGKRKEPASMTSGRLSKKRRLEEEEEEEEEEEWTGIGQISHSSSQADPYDASTAEDIDEDDDFTYNSTAHPPNVVVFSETGASSLVPRGLKSGFMSSKVSKLAHEATQQSQKKEAYDEDEDMTNAQNDALLHRLVHTQLLSGSLNPELNLTPAQRKKALAGRVMEAAGKAKLGKGEFAVRQAEHNRAAKHVRDGLSEKRKERQEKELDEAKHLGNYHPTLKALYDASATSKGQNKKRERGMKMGVGSFKGGTLRLSKSDINAVEGRSGAGRGNGSHRGRGGKR